MRADLERTFGYFPILKERQGQLAGKLSGGEQQMCAIARGLMSNPMLLLIDEFSLGLAPLVVENLVDIVLAIHKEGKTILIVEQDVLTALNISKRGYIIETGRIVMTGESKVLIQDEKVKSSYLGM